MRSTSSSLSSRRARRATWRTCSRSIIASRSLGLGRRLLVAGGPSGSGAAGAGASPVPRAPPGRAHPPAAPSRSAIRVRDRRASRPTHAQLDDDPRRAPAGRRGAGDDQRRAPAEHRDHADRHGQRRAAARGLRARRGRTGRARSRTTQALGRRSARCRGSRRPDDRDVRLVPVQEHVDEEEAAARAPRSARRGAAAASEARGRPARGGQLPRGGSSARRRAAQSVLRSSIAMVIGPTPPGTGVIAPATSATASKSTSPTSPSSSRLVPTSITAAPGLTKSPAPARAARRRPPGRPPARTPPRGRASASGRWSRWRRPRAAAATGLPTRIDRPITTARAP